MINSLCNTNDENAAYLSLLDQIKHLQDDSHIVQVCGIKKAKIMTAINSYCKDDLRFADEATLRAICRLIDEICAAEYP